MILLSLRRFRLSLVCSARLLHMGNFFGYIILVAILSEVILHSFSERMLAIQPIFQMCH